MKIAMTQKKIGWSGQSIHVFDLASGLRERGHQIILMAQPGSAFSQRAREGGFALHEMPMAGLAQVGTLFKMARILRKNRVEVLHCHDARDHQVGCFAARLGGVPAVVRTKHNLLPLRNFFSRLVYGPLSSGLISVSDAVKRSLVESGMKPDHITTVYNFVDTERFLPGPPSADLKKNLGLPVDAPIVGTVGRLHHSKGIAEFIKAMPAVAEGVPGVRFLLVGGRHEQWIPLTEELSVRERCVFPGPVTRVVDFLNLMDVVVFPSYREAFPLAHLEALAARRPVVATRVGGVPELIRDEESGLLVEPRDPEALAAAILRLLRDGDLRNRLAEEGHRFSTGTFTRERCLEGTERAYEKALGNTP